MYTLYIGNKNYSSWSLRPWILMTQLGIPFQEVLVPFNEPGYPAFSSFSPTSKVPCLHDAATRVWDSLSIAEYLAEKHKGVWPADATARAWARSAAAEMHSGFSAIRNACSMTCGVRLKLNGISPDVKRDLDRLSTLWSEGLTRFGGPFLAGPAFTAVDAFYCPVAFRVQSYGLELPQPAADYVKRLLSLEGMKAWYAAALKEPWRDLPHEEEIVSMATVTQDLRVKPAKQPA
ncbi:glutathione S-transferase [Betaproteobacteria bacterium GR16-43]|nr:glutathione S-transferase [Betaproteobacteria bacterium GR16-43]